MRTMDKEEREVMSLVWQVLYLAQDGDKIRRGAKGVDFFHVWRGGKAFKVTVQLDRYENNVRGEEE
tara:strand:+ start:87 stop:284 length:198 start_codon:yes stop_codon:yes gene_type:complete